jgi:uncharacterized protein (DUF1697 family)
MESKRARSGAKKGESLFIALLRGINVGGHNKIPMTQLCSLCAGLGWSDVQSYIQSGNLVFKANDTPSTLEDELERAIERKFGLVISIIVRSAKDWPAYLKGNPFPEASQNEPNAVMMALSKAKPKSDAVAQLEERAVNGERIIRAGDALWLHFKNGMAKSKLTPALLDRLVGSPVTMRNWRTVVKLNQMICDVSSE